MERPSPKKNSSYKRERQIRISYSRRNREQGEDQAPHQNGANCPRLTHLDLLCQSGAARGDLAREEDTYRSDKARDISFRGISCRDPFEKSSTPHMQASAAG